MINLSTIKGKLIALLVLSFISYITVAYMAYSNNNDAGKTMERMLLIGDMRAHANGSMMELRGYQLLYTDDRLQAYRERNAKFEKATKDLIAITRSKENKERLNTILKHHKEWQALNEPRIQIISENENDIHSLEFASTEEGKKLQAITKQSAELYEQLVKQQRELIDEMSKRNIETLNSNAVFMEVIIFISAAVMMGVF